MARWLVFALVACSAPAKPVSPKVAVDADPEGPHRDPVAELVQPYLDHELVTGLVVGLYSAGKQEVYGYGKGPGGTVPDGRTLFELGSASKVFTGLLLADAIQRREVELDTPVAELLPAGVTVPVRDKVAVTMRHLALGSSGLPSLPPAIVQRGDVADPFAGYGEDELYADLIRSELVTVPGTQISYSTYATGLLGFVLGRKIGGGYEKAVQTRIVGPLDLRDTFITVPAGVAARRASGSDDDLKPVGHWTWDALAGAGAIVTSARDLLRLIDLELDAVAGSKAPLRAPMRLTQEAQLDHIGGNLGLGWMIDADGRLWTSGMTGGFRCFIAFDPKQKRGLVLLASTASSLVDRLAPPLFGLLDGTPAKPWVLPTQEQLARFAGSYDFSGTKLSVVAAGKRLYLEGPGEPRRRMLPVSDHEFWLDAVSAVAIFKEEGDKVTRLVFGIGNQQITAPRVP